MSLFLPSYPEWHKDALCAEIGGDLWFPEYGDQVHAAKAVCAVCPVALECLRFALENDEPEGVWGGYSVRQRRNMKRGVPVKPPQERKRTPARVCAYCGKEFRSRHGTAKYCTNVCSNRALRERQVARREQKAAELGQESAA